MKILFIGDVFADIGRRVLAERLTPLIAERGVDCCIANGENAAGGHGMTGTAVGIGICMSGQSGIGVLAAGTAHD